MDASPSSISAYARPALIVICGMLLFNLPTLIYKSQMFLRGIAYLLLCNDKSWRKPSDPSILVRPLLMENINNNDPSKKVLERKTVSNKVIRLWEQLDRITIGKRLTQ